MSLKLLRYGELYIKKHSSLDGRDEPNQHTISSITGLK